MAKDIDLLSYWMPVLRQLREFKEIVKAEEPELIKMIEAIEKALNNMFIETADIDGIKRFEKLLGIYPENTADLELRRNTILAKWYNKVAYTTSEVEKILTAIYGSTENFDFSEHAIECRVMLTGKTNSKGTLEAVYKLLRDILPCNLEIEVTAELEGTATGDVILGTLTSVGKTIVIQEA